MNDKFLIFNLTNNAETKNMTVIVGDRGTGKTTALIQESAAHWYYIVTNSHSSARLIFRMAKEMNVEIPFPLTYDEFVRCEYAGKRIHGLLIDDVDMLLQWMSRAPVKAIVVNANVQLNGAGS